MKKLSLAFAVLILIFFVSCSLSYNEGDYFFIRRAGAEMPVWVRGAESDTFVIFLHGGPGDTAQYIHEFYAFQELEKKYSLVYWDQRSSGVSKGDGNSETFTLDDFVLDLDLLVDVIREKYQPRNIVLLGISWGGTLGTAYLADPLRQEKITGWIESGGGHNMVLLMEKSTEIVKGYAEEQAAAGDDGLWQDAVVFFTENPDPGVWTLENYREYTRYLYAAEPYSYTRKPQPGDIQGPTLKLIFLSPMSFAVFFNPGKLLPDFNILSLDLTEEMDSITLPALFLWGKYDINSPVELAEHGYNSVGTPPDLKEKIILENAGHGIFSDDPAGFLESCTGFIEGLRQGE